MPCQPILLYRTSRWCLKLSGPPATQLVSNRKSSKTLLHSISASPAVWQGCRTTPLKMGCRTLIHASKGGCLRSSLVLLNGLDKEVIAPSLRIWRLDLRPLKTPCFLGQNSLTTLLSTYLNDPFSKALHLSLKTCNCRKF